MVSFSKIRHRPWPSYHFSHGGLRQGFRSLGGREMRDAINASGTQYPKRSGRFAAGGFLAYRSEVRRVLAANRAMAVWDRNVARNLLQRALGQLFSVRTVETAGRNAAR